jgi:hypothetical protein
VNEQRQLGVAVVCLDGHGDSEGSGASAFEWEYTQRQKALFDILHRVHRYARAYVRTGSASGDLSRELALLKQRMSEHCDERVWEAAARTVAIVESALA